MSSVSSLCANLNPNTKPISHSAFCMGLALQAIQKQQQLLYFTACFCSFTSKLVYNTTVPDAMEICFVIKQHVLIRPKLS